MESETNSFEALFGRAGDYFETRLELIRLKSVDKSAGVVSSFASRLTVGLIILIAVIIISIGVSLWVGEYFGNAYYGFFYRRWCLFIDWIYCIPVKKIIAEKSGRGFVH